MAGEKRIRCTKCYAEFSDEETSDANCCPACGTKGVPMFIKHDVEIRINWHELRFLTIWAKNWAAAMGDKGKDSEKTLDAIINRLMKYRPEGVPALTIELEMEELQESFPGAMLLRGKKVVVPPKAHGES